MLMLQSIVLHDDTKELYHVWLGQNQQTTQQVLLYDFGQGGGFFLHHVCLFFVEESE